MKKNKKEKSVGVAAKLRQRIFLKFKLFYFLTQSISSAFLISSSVAPEYFLIEELGGYHHLSRSSDGVCAAKFFSQSVLRLRFYAKNI